MLTQSIWNDIAPIYSYPMLEKNITVDVAIVGGGITGISTACLLAEQGLKVAVLESMKVGGGSSGHSTGNLYFTIDKNLGKLYDKYNLDIIRKIVASRAEAITQMEKWINRFQLDCDFKRQPWILYSTNEKNDLIIEKEHNCAQDADVPMLWADSTHFPLFVSKAVKVKNQAQLNPMSYVAELAHAIRSENLSVFENTRVINLEENKENIKLETTGGSVVAKYAVYATHTPKGIKAIQTVLGPYREYGIACRADEIDFPEGIFWGYHRDGKKYSSRLYERNGKSFVLVVGEPHKVGQSESNKKSIEQLEIFAEKHYGLKDVAFRWGGQHYRPADLLPYIGRETKSSYVFVATGFSTDGLVYGTLAALIIADEIAGKENEWSGLYNAHRFTPVKSTKKFLKENINVAGKYIKDVPFKKDVSNLELLQPGAGGIIEKNGEKIAAYKDENGEITMVSAVCTHMKCIVNWDNAEKTWDCPCHGTRFKTDGTVLEGPAFNPLPVKNSLD